MDNVMCLQFSMQEEDGPEHIVAKGDLCTRNHCVTYAYTSFTIKQAHARY